MVTSGDEIVDIFTNGNSATVNQLNDCFNPSSDIYSFNPGCIVGTQDPNMSFLRGWAVYDYDPSNAYMYYVLYSNGEYSWVNNGQEGLFVNAQGEYYGQERAFQVCKTSPGSGGATGDPHIHTWSGPPFDFQGECDLVLTRSPTFDSGLGFEVQIRTKIQSNWSFIKAAAIRIGQDILEVHSDGAYWINGKSDVDLITSHTELSGYLVTWTTKYLEYGVGHKATQFRISLGGHGHVDINVFKGIIDIKFVDVLYEDFGLSQGLMGTYDDGRLLSRDGSTEFERDLNTDDFGKHWQVRKGSEEHSLFNTAGDGPQYPTECKMPEKSSSLSQRRMLADPEFLEAAKKACSKHSSTSLEKYESACLYDILATGDLDLAALQSL